MFEGHGGSDWQRGVGNAGYDIEFEVFSFFPYSVGDLLENVGVGDGDSQVYIDWRDDAGFEFELAEFDGVDFE